MQLHSLLEIIVPNSTVTVFKGDIKTIGSREEVMKLSEKDGGNIVTDIYINYSQYSYGITIASKRNQYEKEAVTVGDIAKCMFSNIANSHLEIVNPQLERIHAGSVVTNRWTTNQFDLEKYKDYPAVKTCITREGVSIMTVSETVEES